eukprot:12408495-Karenia_brevis.AAC.1
MAFQPHGLEGRKGFEGILREEVVKNQKARMEEFEERMKRKKEKSKDKRDEVIVMGDKERIVGEESRNSGGASSS